MRVVPGEPRRRPVCAAAEFPAWFRGCFAGMRKSHGECSFSLIVLQIAIQSREKVSSSRGTPEGHDRWASPVCRPAIDRLKTYPTGGVRQTLSPSVQCGDPDFSIVATRRPCSAIANRGLKPVKTHRYLRSVATRRRLTAAPSLGNRNGNEHRIVATRRLTPAAPPHIVTFAQVRLISSQEPSREAGLRPARVRHCMLGCCRPYHSARNAGEGDGQRRFFQTANPQARRSVQCVLRYSSGIRSGVAESAARDSAGYSPSGGGSPLLLPRPCSANPHDKVIATWPLHPLTRPHPIRPPLAPPY